MNPGDLGPFDRATPYLVLENTRGERSLWPWWRDVPAGWTPRFGPAEREDCATWLGRELAGGAETAPGEEPVPEEQPVPGAELVPGPEPGS